MLGLDIEDSESIIKLICIILFVSLVFTWASVCVKEYIEELDKEEEIPSDLNESIEENK